MTATVAAAGGLPDTVTAGGALLIIAVMGGVTFLLRLLPFQAARIFRGSELFAMLGHTMPVGVLTVLVVFTITSLTEDTSRWPAVAAATAVTVVAQHVTRKPGVSIFTGTAVYMLLVNTIF
ncbi:AzlD domain-containing protein [Corynebacterium mendelii]|uniref:AzlD domain-containing protein n=1 Tax=Corynebacterium mendelii TaxID=2765362 RepID=A0A939IY44_9CORY|nr:AzlD domain-containing protein [Corynebacterium mendelii]